MPTTQQLRSRLVDKLKDLFQLNQPDLDFGFCYMKAQEATKFSFTSESRAWNAASPNPMSS